MPLEIRELIIKVNIDEPDNRLAASDLEDKLRELKSKIIDECAQRIIRKLETSFER